MKEENSSAYAAYIFMNPRGVAQRELRPAGGDQRNVYANVLLTTRTLEGSAFGQKARGLLDPLTNRLSGGLELARQLSDAAAGAHQLHNSPPYSGEYG